MNAKFKELMSIIKLNSDEYASGQITKIDINKEKLSVNVKLNFNKVMSVDAANLLISRLDEFFKTNFGYKKVKVIISYDDDYIEDDLLNEYYKKIVDELALIKSRFSAITAFNSTVVNNNIHVYVANDQDYSIVNFLVVDINKKFKQYGLKSKVMISISNFETPIMNIIQKNFETSKVELIREQEMYEQNKSNPQQKEIPQRGKKMPRLKALINRTPTALSDIPASEVDIIEHNQKFSNNEFVVVGEVVMRNIKDIVSKKGGKFRIFECTISDGQDSLVCKTFLSDNNPTMRDYCENEVKEGIEIRVAGNLAYDTYSRDVVLNITDMVILGAAVKNVRTDTAKVKRVELHAHTKMSVQDGVMDVNEYVRTISEFGHRAAAITDTYNIHAFPDFYDACKKYDILPILGVEGALVDESDFRIALTNDDFLLRDATYVVYDFETTGLSSVYDEIIEIAAIKMKNGLIIDEFSTYVKPKKTISAFITDITSITNDDVRNAPSIEEVMPKYVDFCNGCVLVAHNATFDNSHLYENMKRLGLYKDEFPSIDTLQLAKVKYAGNKLKRFNLKAVAKFFDVDLEQHHRAIYDARTTASIFNKMLNDLLDSKIINYKDINKIIDNEESFKQAYPSKVSIISKNVVGKKNLYKIISDSHTNHFFREPRILKSFLTENREGLLIGSGLMDSDIFDTAYQKGYEELLEKMKFYDYIELQPLSTYDVLVQKNKDDRVKEYVKDTIKMIIKAAKELGKMVVATGNVFHLNKEDVIIREIYVDAPKLGGGTHYLSDIEKIPSFHLLTTNEMLEEFSFLDDEVAHEIVVKNTNAIADMIEHYELFPKQLFAPADDSFKDIGISSFQDGVVNMSYEVARKRYGDNLPELIEDRMKKELKSIIGNNFASIYYISHMLVKHSIDDGYVVGSRGSVGSSLIANLMMITEVNPLPPHYYCPHCHFNAIKMSEDEKKIYPRTNQQIAFEDKLNNAFTGYDLEEAHCPECNTLLLQDGVDIPFETFLGFKGDKVPDIDLNFSGDYQSKAHEFTRELFGENHAFRAGTISTIASKTAYGYVMKYFEKRGQKVRKAEIERLITKVEGVKRSTGQHPGGIVVFPKDVDYTDLVPIQYPADDTSSSWRTTHFDYHKFEENLLKLDILGHDDPTMIRHLMDFVEAYPEEFPFKTVEDIPLSDKNVFGLFNGLSSINLNSDLMMGESIGTTGIPEFGTSLAKDMLSEIRPTTVSELLKISGLSHGTGVWGGNSRDFFLGLKDGYPKVPFNELIGCRDDIMVYLMSKNIPANDAFKIMESVRKGRGVSKDFEKLMISYNIPKWYIESCKLIQYMFPKAHATAYVIMALRIGWFKVYRPIFYYAAYFSRRASAFDVIAMARGYDAIKVKILELKEKIDNKSATAKEIDLHYSLLLSLEATARGFTFRQMDIRYSDATNFKVSKDRKSLLIPFNALESLGESIAISIVNARKEAEFTSKKDVMTRTKLTSTQFEKMNMMGVFGDLPDDDQIGLF
ncbi:MAG: PolC-type DNA polymerase III [Bacilli bacterium]